MTLSFRKGNKLNMVQNKNITKYWREYVLLFFKINLFLSKSSDKDVKNKIWKKKQKKIRKAEEVAGLVSSLK